MLNFENLFILDLANNHQGDLDHGLNIIRQAAEKVKKHNIKAAIKFQFRELDTFIHPLEQENLEHKQIKRFNSTRMSWENFELLLKEVKAQGLLSMCTPFDEGSVDRIVNMGFDLIKVASCSADDWPLLQKIAKAKLPTVISTGGLNFNQIDKLVNFFGHRDVRFALMHCVSIYPTPNHQLNLNQVANLKKRYPEIQVGWSTHEEQDNYDPIKIAYAQGARLFERHIGLRTEKYELNNYSSTPDQLDKWFEAFHTVVTICGPVNRPPSSPKELADLKSLKRGVFVKKNIKKGEAISRADVFFAIPLQDGQLTSGEWHEGIIADQDYEQYKSLNDKLAHLEKTPNEVIYELLLQTKGLLNNARVVVGKDSSVEISHHYGLERFREFGAVIVDCINRNYCKKILVQLPRQKHPYHYHKRKEETFVLLWGDLEVELDGHKHNLKPGDQLLIKPNQWHKFHTLDGAVVEEVSTTHYNDDSFYEDAAISRLDRERRKTQIESWHKYIY